MGSLVGKHGCHPCKIKGSIPFITAKSNVIIFEKGIVARHLDGNSLNNSWNNIRIGTPSDNQMDRDESCRKNSATIASRKMQNNIRSYEERCLIYEDLKNGISYSEIMNKHNISSKGTLSFMKNKSLEYKEYMEMLAQ